LRFKEYVLPCPIDQYTENKKKTAQDEDVPFLCCDNLCCDFQAARRKRADNTIKSVTAALRNAQQVGEKEKESPS
jgi:hypothetical protein